MFKTYSEVVNIQLGLPCYRNPLVRYKRNQAGTLLERAENPIIPFVVILLHLNGKKKRCIFLFNYLLHLIPMWLIDSTLGGILPISSTCSFIQ